MLALICWLWSGAAEAGVPMALDPLNRVMLGATWVGGPSPVGFSGSFESRTTRILAAELGGFVTPFPMEPGLGEDAARDVDLFYLRHGIFGDLGFRIPHHQPKGFAWEFHFRLGTGVVWNAHVSNDALVTDNTNYDVAPSVAALGGGDFLIRFGHYGARVAGKAWAFNVVDQREITSEFKISPQISLEALVQW